MFGLFGSSQNTADATVRVNYRGENAVQGLQKLKSTLGTIVSALAVKQLAEFTYNLGEMGAKAQVVEANFNRMAGMMNRNADDMRKALRNASMGMVDDITLQQNAMKALIGGVKFDDLVVAMEYVTKFATATGIDVNEKMTTVMTGLARGSAAFLDDVGIQVMGAQDVVGAAIEQMRQKMDTFASSEDDAATKAARLKADLENVKIQISQELVPAFAWFNDIILDTITGWKQLAETGDALKATAKTLVATILPILNVRMKKGDESLLDKIFGDVGSKNKELDELMEKNKRLAEATKQRNFLLEELAAASAGNIDTVFASTERGMRITTDQAIKMVGELNAEIASLGPGKKGSPKNPFGKTGPDEETIKEAERIAAKAREDVMKESMQGRLDLLYDQYSKEYDLLRKAGQTTVFLTRAYENERAKIVEESYKEIDEYSVEAIDRRNKEVADGLRKEGELTEEQYDKLLAYRKELHRMEVGETQVMYEEKLAMIEEDLRQGVLSEEQAYKLRMQAAKEMSDYLIEQEEKVQKARINNVNTTISNAQTLLNSLTGYSDAYTDREMRNVQDLYEKKKITEEEYNDRVAEIQAEADERNRAFARAQQAIILARAISDAIAAGVGAAKDQSGGAVTRILSMATTIAAAMLEVATIEAQTFAKGTRSSNEGLAWVGEQGPELVRLPRGSEVMTAQESAMTSSGTSVENVNNYYGLSTEQVIAIQRNNERRQVTGTLI